MSFAVFFFFKLFTLSNLSGKKRRLSSYNIHCWLPSKISKLAAYTKGYIFPIPLKAVCLCEGILASEP